MFVYTNRETREGIWMKEHLPYLKGCVDWLRSLRWCTQGSPGINLTHLVYSPFPGFSSIPVVDIDCQKARSRGEGRDLNELPGPNESGAGGEHGFGLREKARGGRWFRGERRRTWRGRRRPVWSRCWRGSRFGGEKRPSPVPPASHGRLQGGLRQPGANMQYASCRHVVPPFYECAQNRQISPLTSWHKPQTYIHVQ